MFSKQPDGASLLILSLCYNRSAYLMKLQLRWLTLKTVQIRLPKEEKSILDAYCKKTGRTQSDILREFIRSLPS